MKMGKTQSGRGRPKTKVNKLQKVLMPNFKARLNEKTVIQVRSLEILEALWRPLYPNLVVIK
ncbi:MAG: hypothetical protein SH857_15765 [Chitinophagales bacterium]|nr:hypothetical protein [Chitinophagales bacterium]